MQNTNLAGRVAVVTGSTSGIGLAIAQALAGAGAAVMLNGFGSDAAIAAAEAALRAQGGGAVAFSPADMSDPQAIAGLMHATQSKLGSVDILINNAGIQFVAPVQDFPPAGWDRIIAINLSAAFHTSRAVLPGMIARGFGRIINVASAHGLVASPYKSAYVAAKHGMLGLTKTIALEVAEAGITCNAVCPGYVATPLVERQIDDQARAHNISREAVVRDVMLARQPNKAFIESAHLADLCLFLCGPSAAGITGAALPVDGGWTAQ